MHAILSHALIKPPEFPLSPLTHLLNVYMIGSIMKRWIQLVLGSSPYTGLLPSSILEHLVAALKNDVQSLKEEKTTHLHGLVIEELAFAMVQIPNSPSDFQKRHSPPDIEPQTCSSGCLVSCKEPTVRRL